MLAGRPGHRPAAEYVRMDVVDGLPGLRAGVEDHAVAVVGDSLGDGNVPGVGHELGQQALIGGGQPGQIRVMGPRDHQHVDRGLRVDIAKGDSTGTSRHNRGRNVTGGNGAEQAISHVAILTSARPATSCTYMVALLRTHGAPPPAGATASPGTGFPSLGDWSCTGARAGVDGCGGNWKQLGSHIWRPSVAAANDGE